MSLFYDDQPMRARFLTILFLGLAGGCASPPQTVVRSKSSPAPSESHHHRERSPDAEPFSDTEPPDLFPYDAIVLTGSQDEARKTSPARQPVPQDATTQPEPQEPNAAADRVLTLSLATVITSVHESFPLVEAAYRETDIAGGNAIAAQGAFDTKLKASSENGPTGFYRTYRQQAGISRPLFNGGEVFGGYRIGRGSFEPWYRERQTNDGGELKVGATVPLVRNRAIDARRAALWRANYNVRIAQPAIRGQLIAFSLDASLAYWKWVAEGRKYFAEREWLELADRRTSQIERRVQEGDLDPPEQTDNDRAIAKRKAKVADQLRRVQQAAVKLSLFYRDQSATPVVPSLEEIPEFPEPQADTQMAADLETALARRPDLQIIRLQQERLRVDYRAACNDRLPRLDAMIAAGQDVGAPTSSKRDKSRLEVDAGLFFDLPLQRRKALGKMQAIEAKLAQVSAKERFTIDKITAGVRAASVGIVQAREQLRQAQRARTLAGQMAAIERRKFELGESDLLKVALREQYALEAVEGEVAAFLNFFSARSLYRAELGFDR